MVSAVLKLLWELIAKSEQIMGFGISTATWDIAIHFLYSILNSGTFCLLEAHTIILYMIFIRSDLRFHFRFPLTPFFNTYQ
jgi:hypothetical protein